MNTKEITFLLVLIYSCFSGNIYPPGTCFDSYECPLHYLTREDNPNCTPKNGNCAHEDVWRANLKKCCKRDKPVLDFLKTCAQNKVITRTRKHLLDYSDAEWKKFEKAFRLMQSTADHVEDEPDKLVILIIDINFIRRLALRFVVMA